MKKLQMAMLVVGAVVLAGCGNKAANNQGDISTGKVQEMTQGQSGGGVISSIKDAMGLGKAMKCTYKMKNEAGGLESVTYVDGKKYMTEMAAGGVMQRMVFDGEVMYSWSEKDKKGTKIDMACMEGLEKYLPEKENNDISKNIPDPTGEKTFADAMDVKCEPAAGADFSIPTDVIFTDQCEMMKSMMKNVPANISNIPKNIPPGMPNINITE